jgi:FKBP-type peptidyl-prolyl cis-trans isomerase
MRRALASCVLLSLLLAALPSALAQDAPTDQAEAVAAAPVELVIEDLRPGVGETAVPGMQVVVHYTGWIYQPNALGFRGRQFDSSQARGQPFSLRLGEGRVIAGWEQGLPGLRVGGLRRLVIPPHLAYGNRDIRNGLIPPGSTLVFEVELLAVESNTVMENVR